jgi:hypothetical protein
VIDPHAPRDFSLRTSLIDLERRGQLLSGTYRPTSTSRTIEVRAPKGHVIVGATIDGAHVAGGASSITLSTTSTPATFTVMTSY